MSTSADFEAAQARVKTLRSTPSPDELLALYALFKQGTQGDVTGSRPGMLDFKGRAKFDAWEKKKGLARDAAQTAYVELVAKLEARYGKALRIATTFTGTASLTLHRHPLGSRPMITAGDTGESRPE